jgi:hypothetical protein
MRVRTLLISSLLLTTLAACGRNGITNQPASLVSSSSIWLRNTYDTDPSIYVGRFVPVGATELDESNTMVLACSKHITTRFIEGGNVEYSEEMQVSTEVAIKLGIPVVASGSGAYEQRRTARASYTMTGKMVAEITDPEAFAACCKAQPDQCTDRFIGEFIQGTGKLEHQASRDIDLQGEGTNPQTGIKGEGGVARSAEYQRAAEFPEPVYFAFKINPTPYTQGAVDTCPDWASQPPPAEDGIYVVGSAENAKTESAARKAALDNAGGLAYQSSGVSVPVRPDSWCVTSKKVNKRGKLRYAARVLAFISADEIAAARERARIAAEQDAARRQAELEAAAEQAKLEREKLERERLDGGGTGGGTGTVDPGNGTGGSEEPGFEEPGFEEPIDPTNPTDPTNPNPGGGGDKSARTGDIERIMTAVNAESFSEDKLSALQFSAKNASVTAAEARRVLDAFASSDDKLSALRILRDKISDPDNWQVIIDGFSFSDDRETARSLAP